MKQKLVVVHRLPYSNMLLFEAVRLLLIGRSPAKLVAAVCFQRNRKLMHYTALRCQGTNQQTTIHHTITRRAWRDKHSH